MAHHEQQATAQQQRFVSEQQHHEQQHEESVREMEQIRHTNATLDMAGSDSFRAKTEQAAIRIVTPHYKIPDRPGTDVKIGADVADLSAKFAAANGDYKAERSQEHFRMQIIDPKVASHAHIPAHAIRDYARRHLITDFPSLHGKRSFLDLDALEQLRLRRQGTLGQATDRDKDLEKYLKNRDGKRWETVAPAKAEDESLRELDRLRQNIDQLQKARHIPRVERSIVKVEAPAPIVRHEPRRKEVVEVRREVIKAPTVKHTVHRVVEKKRTEDVERRVVRKERRHKSRRLHRGYHSSMGGAGGIHQEYHYGTWGGGGGGGGGYHRSSSASRRSAAAGYTNGFGPGAGVERHLPITYEGNRSYSSRAFDSSPASDRFFGRQQQQNGFAHDRFGSVSESLRRGDLKYGPNGELRVNGTGNVKANRVHKAHSTRDVFYHDDGGPADRDSHYSYYGSRRGAAGAEPAPFVEFPPTLDRRSDWSSGVEPPPHRRQFADEFGGAAVGGGGGRQITKARSFADWEEGGRRGDGIFGSRYDDEMARLENEFRDARLMRIPSGSMHEKVADHREIPGGYESYEREVKAHSNRKVDGEQTPAYSREASQEYSYKRDGQK